MRMSLLAVLGLAILLPAVSVQADEASRLDKQINDFTLQDFWGKEHSLSDYDDSEVVVVAFLGAECPLAKLYGRRLAEMSDELSERGVTFLGINSNRQDSLQEINAYARRHGIEFPILKDAGNAVADQFAAIRTPEVFVLDKARNVRYWGRIDDQYGFGKGVGYQRPAPTRNDLAEAVTELLAGDSVSVPQTEALGCHIGRVREVTDDSEVTYSNQIARVIQNNCLDCHREGRIGPFTMESYDDVVGWGEMIREVVQEERMPPWHADPKHGQFANDSRLSDDEKELIYAWVDNGCPEGDPADLPEPRQFAEGWQIPEPDQIIYACDEPVDVAADGVIPYYNFIVDPGWTEDVWIQAAEPKPGSLETVHHILVFMIPPGQDNPSAGFGALIGAYAPGANSTLDSDGDTAFHVPAGSKLHFQLHYTPNGVAQKDRSYLGVKFADPANVKYEAKIGAVINPMIEIPAGEANYTAKARRKLRKDTVITALGPHMHNRGKAFKFEAEYPDGSREVLLDVPRYDFNWQYFFVLEEPKLLPRGTRLHCTAVWDNSEENLSNPDPTETVVWGDQTFEEMMIGFTVEVTPIGEGAD